MARGWKCLLPCQAVKPATWHAATRMQGPGPRSGSVAGIEAWLGPSVMGTGERGHRAEVRDRVGCRVLASDDESACRPTSTRCSTPSSPRSPSTSRRSGRLRCRNPWWGEIIGLAPTDSASFVRHSREQSLLKYPKSTFADKLARMRDRAVWADGIRALIRDRRRDARDDVITALLHAEQAGDRLHEPEMISPVMLLFAAGFDTSNNMMSNGIPALFQPRDQYAARLGISYHNRPDPVRRAERTRLSGVVIPARPRLRRLWWTSTLSCVSS